jgi:hypothetical protein
MTNPALAGGRRFDRAVIILKHLSHHGDEGSPLSHLRYPTWGAAHMPAICDYLCDIGLLRRCTHREYHDNIYYITALGEHVVALIHDRREFTEGQRLQSIIHELKLEKGHADI